MSVTIPIRTRDDFYRHELQARCAFVFGESYIVLNQPDLSRISARVGETVTIHDDGTITVTRTEPDREEGLW